MSGINQLLDSEEIPAPKSPKTPKRDEKSSKSAASGGSGSFGTGDVGENDSCEIGPFPTQCLPPIIRNMIQESSRVTQTPDALGALVALGILSASYGGGLLVRSGAGRITPPNLFLLGIARSGVGKGRAFGLIAKPFLNEERECVSRWMELEKPRIEAALRIATRRAEAKEKEAAREPNEQARRMLASELQQIEEEKQRLERERETPPHFSVGDVTREKLAVSLSTQPGEALVSLSSEARGIIGVVMGRYSGGKASDEDIYLSGYSGDPLRVDRQTRAPVMLHAPRLSLAWLIQPDVARKLAEDERMTESGFLPRLLLCDVKAESEDEPEDFPELKQSVAEEWRALILELLGEYREKGNNPRTIHASDDARAILRKFTNDSKARVRDGGELRDVDSYVARWGENAWRLALCLHGALHGRSAHLCPLGANEAQAAVEIVKWFARAQLDFLAISRSDRAKLRLERVMEILRSAGGTKTLNNLRKSHGFEESELRTLAERYPTKLRIEILKTGGRDSTVAYIPGKTTA